MKNALTILALAHLGLFAWGCQPREGEQPTEAEPTETEGVEPVESEQGAFGPAPTGQPETGQDPTAVPPPTPEGDRQAATPQPSELPGAADGGEQQQAQQGEQPQGEQLGQQGQAASLRTTSQEPYGEFLVNAQGQALYMFTADQKGQSSACKDDCAEAWPPVYTEGDPEAAAPGLNAQLLGTITRDDGRKQVTYNGWPLYTYAGDASAGQVTGQDVKDHGGEWYLLSPQGEKIEAERPAGS